MTNIHGLHAKLPIFAVLSMLEGEYICLLSNATSYNYAASARSTIPTITENSVNHRKQTSKMEQIYQFIVILKHKQIVNISSLTKMNILQ